MPTTSKLRREWEWEIGHRRYDHRFSFARGAYRVDSIRGTEGLGQPNYNPNWDGVWARPAWHNSP